MCAAVRQPCRSLNSRRAADWDSRHPTAPALAHPRAHEPFAL